MKDDFLLKTSLYEDELSQYGCQHPYTVILSND